VGLFASATFAGAWCVMLVAGSVTDRFGVRRMLSLGQAVTGSLLLAMAAVGSALQAAVVMFAAGVGRGTVFPGSSKAIMEWFPASTRATAMGIKADGGALRRDPGRGDYAGPGSGLRVANRPSRPPASSSSRAASSRGCSTESRHSERSRTAGASMRSGLQDVLSSRRFWTLGCIALLFIMAQQSLLTYLALYLKEVVLLTSIPDEPTRILAAGGYLALCQAGARWQGVLGHRGRPGLPGPSDRGPGDHRGHRRWSVGGDRPPGVLPIPRAADGDPGCRRRQRRGWNGVYHTVLTETAGARTPAPRSASA